MQSWFSFKFYKVLMQETYIEEHANNAHDFFFVEVVQDFGNQLNDVQLKVSE